MLLATWRLWLSLAAIAVVFVVVLAVALWPDGDDVEDSQPPAARCREVEATLMALPREVELTAPDLTSLTSRRGAESVNLGDLMTFIRCSDPTSLPTTR